jgi:putative PIN family toxin of toxin-antitoxin system
MRIVVDTNVFVSAAIKQASWPASVVRWIDRHGGFIKSKATEDQVIEVLQRPYIASRMPPSYFDNVRRIFSAAELVIILESIVACRDPTDDKFLELAVNGRADMIVSGDLDLLVLHPFRGIPIIDPAAFVQGVAGAPGV